MNRRRLSHPLPPNFFQSPAYAPGQTNAIMETGVEALKHLVLNARLDGSGPHKWKLEHANRQVQIYVDGNLGRCKDTIFMSVTEIHATLDEAAALHRCDTQEAYRQFIKRFNRDVIDGAILKTLAPPTEDFPRNYIGLKWFVQETPVPCRNRDFCVVECCDDFVLNGTKGWARVLHSVDLCWVPSLYSTMGIVRGIFTACGTVFQETDRPGVLRAAQIFHVDLRGNIPRWILRIGIKKRARTMADMEAHFRVMRMQHMTILPSSELIPVSHRRRCCVCQVKFKPLQERANCRRCGEVMCAKCSREVDVPDRDTLGFCRVSLCLSCAATVPSSSSQVPPPVVPAAFPRLSRSSRLTAESEFVDPRARRYVVTSPFGQHERPSSGRLSYTSPIHVGGGGDRIVLHPHQQRRELRSASTPSTTHAQYKPSESWDEEDDNQVMLDPPSNVLPAMFDKDKTTHQLHFYRQMRDMDLLLPRRSCSTPTHRLSNQTS
ncbi:unnamed protein product [Aphanomyces euteiches]|uniref:FYVE-type domain-containing protein n=1 Tax=Aphanomyces euteiches TaxID=100861 RepID=A0A6G0WTI5_9STRA|nr:hypothetical protein Ae201684_011819 [Aphanomyces euteiches]KAH9089160.1 hypothetical protein Ae201684P_001366 [Aphanomyces euteiches]KAH9138959.1 hypothetical protein AeRB84_016755 [Aphanomyces euteiches]